MAFSINKVYLVGNVTKEPVVKHTPNGNAVCTFNLATNRSVKKGDEFEDVPTYHRIVVWGKIGEWIGNNVAKGEPMVVEGRIDNRSYEQDGVTKYISEVVADNAIPFARKGKGSSSARSQEDNELVKAAESAFGVGKSTVQKQATVKKASPSDDIMPADDEDDDGVPF